MNFDLTEDEEMLKALAERFVNNQYDMDRRRAFQAEACGFSAANWALLGELGLIGALLPADAGGMDLDATGITTLFEALGRGLVVEPLGENVVLAARLLAATAPQAVRDAWLPTLLTGEQRIALAHAESASRPGLWWVETAASSDDDKAALNGAKAYVPSGAGADAYIVTARITGAPDATDGVGLYLVAADAPGLSIRPWRLADGSVAVSLQLDNVVPLAKLGDAAAYPHIEQAELLAALARCAEALGIMERMFSETLEYLRTREQFGAKLGSFQALQHRMVKQYTMIEQCRALMSLALVSWNTPDFARAVYGFRAFIAPASVDLGHEMIQFHGGMGVTDELAIGHAHKRLLVLSRWPDNAETALDRFAFANVA